MNVKKKISTIWGNAVSPPAKKKAPPKPVKVYTLYRNGGITSNSQCYKHGVPIIIVAAKSINQAYYFAHNEVWFDADSLVGILEETLPSGDGWINWKGAIGHARFGVDKAKPLPKTFINEVRG